VAGLSINVITLLALSLVVGILVDDAIVEVENIVRHLRMGKTPYQAAMEAADEIGLAVIATTFTLIAVFLPTAFMSGIAGKFFKQFGWTAALVFASLVVARLLTPMMAAYILKPIVADDEPRWMGLPALGRWCLRTAGHLAGHPVLRRLAGADPAAAHGLHPARRQLADPGVPGAAPGATLAQTRAVAERAGARPAWAHVKSVYTTIGGGSAGRPVRGRQRPKRARPR
jgi:multidrug efflux pump subunit AcrB